VEGALLATVPCSSTSGDYDGALQLAAARRDGYNLATRTTTTGARLCSPPHSDDGPP